MFKARRRLFHALPAEAAAAAAGSVAGASANLRPSTPSRSQAGPIRTLQIQETPRPAINRVTASRTP